VTKVNNWARVNELITYFNQDTSPLATFCSVLENTLELRPSVQVELDDNARMNTRDDKPPLFAQEELLQFSIFLYDVLRGEHHDIEPELSIMMSVANKIKDYLE